MGANDRIRVGIIGSGGMGKGDLETFFLNPEVDCPVVCDVDDFANSFPKATPRLENGISVWPQHPKPLRLRSP